MLRKFWDTAQKADYRRNGVRIDCRCLNIAVYAVLHESGGDNRTSSTVIKLKVLNNRGRPLVHLVDLHSLGHVSPCHHSSFCSAKTLLNLSETFWFAQKAVLYPTAPLYDAERKELTPACVRALIRVFRICDTDNDGYLSDRELEAFQSRCFSVPLTTQSLQDVKQLVRQSCPGGVTLNGITQKGKLFKMRCVCVSITCSSGRRRLPKTIHLTSALLIRLPHQIRAMRRGQRCSNTDSSFLSCFLNGQVPSPYSRTGRTAAEYTRPLTDSRMSRRRHKCLNSANANRAFCLRADTSSVMRRPGEM
ncbi:unnamed protein product [Echinostoma caproni]|uniref:EF-hand domain-containing protein n=1 Tax=Echinostoma caproni TaxID=27848 RepID=A0A183ALC0_9TREM|nr:unnamed protein product [Echinostoma caproni]